MTSPGKDLVPITFGELILKDKTHKNESKNISVYKLTYAAIDGA